MKSRWSCVVLVTILSLLATLSCFTGDDSNEDSCVDTNTLDGQTFELGAGAGVFASEANHACGTFYMTYRDGGLRLDRFGPRPIYGGDRIAYAANGDVWIWIDEARRLTQLTSGEFIDHGDMVGTRSVGGALVTTTGVAYLLLVDAATDDPVELLKYEGEHTESIALPEGAWTSASMSSHGDLLALVLVTDYPEGAIHVLRDGVWEEGPPLAAPNNELSRGISIVGDGAFWMWSQAPDAHQDDDPWYLNRYEDGAWTRIHQTDFRIRGVLSDEHDRLGLWGDTSRDDELGGRTYGVGAFEVLSGEDWNAVTFSEVKWPFIYRAAMDASGAIWVAGSRHADSSQADCIRKTVRLPFFSVYRDGAWTTPKMPDEIREHLRDVSKSGTCDAGE